MIISSLTYTLASILCLVETEVSENQVEYLLETKEFEFFN